MKYLITTIAAVVLVGCEKPEPPTISIHLSADNGNIEAVKQHLAAGTDVNVKDADMGGWTPLHYAAAQGHKEIAKLLIAEGANLNATDYIGTRPLHMAAYMKSDVAELLIANGADVNAKDNVGETPLDSAILGKRTTSADLLRKHGGKSGAEDSVHVAASVENIEAVIQHLAAGTDVNAKNYDGDTPLHIAARRGYKEIAELLIAKGANVNAKGKNGDRPLDWAVHIEYTNDDDESEIANLLRKHGAKTGEELKAEGK